MASNCGTFVVLRSPTYKLNLIVMKKIILIWCICIIGLSSCKKDDDDNNNNTTPTPITTPSTFSCKLDGQSFVADTVNIKWVSSSSSDKIGCAATDAAGNILSFVVNATTPGSYVANGLLDGAGMLDFSYEPFGESSFFIHGSQDSATVVFTTISNYDQSNMSISGSFAFSVTRGNESKHITQGNFANVKW